MRETLPDPSILATKVSTHRTLPARKRGTREWGHGTHGEQGQGEIKKETPCEMGVLQSTLPVPSSTRRIQHSYCGSSPVQRMITMARKLRPSHLCHLSDLSFLRHRTADAYNRTSTGMGVRIRIPRAAPRLYHHQSHHISSHQFNWTQFPSFAFYR